MSECPKKTTDHHWESRGWFSGVFVCRDCGAAIIRREFGYQTFDCFYVEVEDRRVDVTKYADSR